jgi:hypothetical protein
MKLSVKKAQNEAKQGRVFSFLIYIIATKTELH